MTLFTSRNKLPFLFGVVSFAGFIDASYLALKHYLGEPITCSLFKGCEVVTTSSYATLFNVPISLFGAIYYLTLLVLIILFFDQKNVLPLYLASGLTIFGVLTSASLIFIQVFIVEAFCLYCLISALTCTALFILAIFIVRNLRRGYYIDTDDDS